jgi:hypothetical protein
MASLIKESPVFDMDVSVAESVDLHGGLVNIDALAREFGLWDKIRAIPQLDPRRDRRHGFSPEVLVAQIVLSLCTGGAGLSDAEELFRGAHPVVNQLTGIERGADASTLGQWLRAQTPEGVEALQRLLREFVGWVLARAPSEAVRRDGTLEVFFDDTQLELHGRYFEGAAKNYNGDTTLSWQTFWVGPFVVAGNLGTGSRDVSGELPSMIGRTRALWAADAEAGRAHFYADSGSSAGHYLQAIDAETWGWSVSYNKNTTKLAAFAAELPATRWTSEVDAVSRTGEDIRERHGWVKHLPGEGLDHALDFATVAWRPRQGLAIWNHAFVVGRAGAQAEAHLPERARELFSRHHLKGDRERGFSELLSDLDLHHPPCQSLAANQMFYTLGMLAYNLLRAFAVLRLNKEDRPLRARSLIRRVISVPVRIARHAHRIKVRVFCPLNWLRWWREYFADVFPRRPRGRPFKRRAHPPPG